MGTLNPKPSKEIWELDNLNNNSKIFSLSSNSQLTHAQLKLGIGQIRSSDKHNGDQPIIGQYYVYLWPFLKGESKGRPAMLIWKGMTLQIGVYTVNVLEIDKTTVKLAVS